MRRNPVLVILALVVALHVYIGLRLLPALALGPLGLGIGAALLAASSLLVPAPFLIRLSRLPVRYGDALAWAGYLTMGAFSGLLVLCLVRDLTLLVLAIGALAMPGTLDLEALRRLSAEAVIALALLVSAVGLINARRLARVVEVDLPIAGLPAALQGFCIVQISDIHVGPTIKRATVEAIVRRVNMLQADLVAITGDVIDGSVAQLRAHVAPLAELHSRHGTFCVTGNHEYYHGANAWVAEWRRMGLQVLMNQNQVLHHDGARLLIGGVTDFSAGHYEVSHASDPVVAARCSESVAAKILLAHQPRSAAAADAAGFDVQLSGHTHGGQFLPWNFFVPMQQPFVAGLKRLNNLLVYTSRGTGYWGPPLRFGAPSEITRLRLVSAL